MIGSIEQICGQNDAGKRIDNILRTLTGLPFASLQKAFRKGKIRMNGQKVHPDARAVPGDRLSFPQDWPRLESKGENRPPEPPSPLPILFENPHLLILNKAAGDIVHGNDRSLEAQVRRYLAPKIPASLSFRPGPLHRLDVPTSGVLCFGVSLEGARQFSEALRNKTLKKWYIARVQGCLNQPMDIQGGLKRQSELHRTDIDPDAAPSRTYVWPIWSGAAASWVLASPESGRTHQIRAHLAACGHPLSGDRVYGASPLSGPLYLHAWLLDFPPDSRDRNWAPSFIQADPPRACREAWKADTKHLDLALWEKILAKVRPRV